MQSRKSTEFTGSERLIERQMLLSRFREMATVRKKAQEKAGRYRFITLSRDYGALGNFVASDLAARLRWQVFDKEIVNYVAENSRVSHELVQGLDEKAQNLIHDMVDRFLRMAEGISFGNEEYRKALLRTLATIAAHGGAIIVGRGGTYALQGEPGLHIRITACLDTRIDRISKRLEISLEEARRQVLQVDSERRSFLQQHFSARAEDERYYDLIFNTDRMSVKQIADSVLAAMEARESLGGEKAIASPVK